MRITLLTLAAVALTALPALAYERHEIKSGDRVLGTITEDQTTHEYAIQVPKDALLTMSLPKIKGSRLLGSMSIVDQNYRGQRLFLTGKRKIQTESPPPSTVTYRALVQGVNESVGDYLLKPKLKVRKRYKIRGKRSQLSPPGRIVFGALEGYQVQVTVKWKGPDPVTIASFTDPDGNAMTSELEAKEKRLSFRQKGFMTTQTGDYEVVLGIPDTAKQWVLDVRLKGKPIGQELQLREDHAMPPELDLSLAQGPIPLIVIHDEEGGGNEVVLSGDHRTPRIVAILGPEPENCEFLALEAGNSPSGYAIECDESHSALIAVGERDENLRILDYVADPVVGPSGEGTVSFSSFGYTTDTGRNLTGWTEVRTFANSGNEHTLEVLDIERLAGGIFIYSVIHTRPDGTTRRYDRLPFNN